MQLTPPCYSEGGKTLVLDKVEIEGLACHLIYLAGPCCCTDAVMEISQQRKLFFFSLRFSCRVYKTRLAGTTAKCISAPRSTEGDCRRDLLSTDLQQFCRRPPLQLRNGFVGD